MDGRERSSVFVGRRDQVTNLVSHARRTRKEGAGAVLIGGEAGVGKSRLLREYARTCPMRLAVAGGCPELGVEGLPYAPFTAALRRLIRDGAAPASGGPGELARLLPELGSAPAGPEQGRARLFEEVLVLLEGAAAPGGLTLVLEDLHWSDASTRDLLVFLLGNLDAAPVQIIATYRTDDLHRGHPLRRLLPELERLPGVDRTELPPLSREEVAELAEGLHGSALPDRQADRLFERSGGNPLFVESFLEHPDAGTAPVPDGPRELLLGAVRTLDAEALGVLRAASAAGERVHHALLEAVSGSGPAEFAAAVRAAVDANALVPRGEGYAFRHALLAEAVQEDLLPAERTRLHRRYTDVLEQGVEGLEPDQAALLLAHHAYAAHDLPRALEGAWRAAEAAHRGAALPERVSLLERVLDLWEQVPDAQGRIGCSRTELLYLLSQAAHDIGAPRRAAEYAAEGLKAYSHWLDTGMCEVRSARVVPEADAIAMGRLLQARGDARKEMSQDGALEDYGEALLHLPRAHPLRARITAGLATTLMVRGHDDEARRAAELALERARAAADVRSEADALITLGSLDSHGPDTGAAVEYIRQGVRSARDSGDVSVELRGRNNLAATYDMAGHPEEAMRENRDGLKRVAELGLTRTQGGGFTFGLAHLLFAKGELDEARDVLRAMRPDPNPRSQGRRHRLLAEIERMRGSVADVAREVEAFDRLMPPESSAQIETLSNLGSRAWLMQADGRAEEGVDLLLTAMEEERPWARGVWIGMNLAHVAGLVRDIEREAVGDPARSAAVERFKKRVEDKAQVLPSDEGSPFMVRVDARIVHGHLATGGAPRAADEHWAWVERETRSRGLKLDLLQALFGRAECALALGERERAAEQLRELHFLASECGAAPYLQRAQRAMEGAGIAPPRVASAAPDGTGDALPPLTPREREVLRLVARGRTNREIAGELVISAKTVSVHVSNVLGKLDVTNRNAAARKALDSGLG
ncbi:helix-turn-helix transcriptional regulator [Nocardiopsis halophila]|uniref:helix-turn-helix transcriptional regulator n=1 Tax=Nocardiopsis halophila TaxID=141692 RepID=UPI000347A696|nr:AAA family ATPase [Nocardiopsis halophila]